MKTTLLLLSSILLSGCTPPVEPAVSGGEVDGEALREALVELADQSKFPGLSACVFTIEQTDWCGGVGVLDPTGDAPVTADSPFLLASVSKMITAATAMQAVEADLIDLDSPASEHADFALQHPSGAALTMRQLLQHSAAIADNDDAMGGYYTDGADPDMSLDEAVRRYFDPAGADFDASANFADRAPGVSFDYSNMGIALAGWLVERTTGRSFDANTATGLFGPLGLENTSWWLSDFEEGELAMPSEWINNAWQPYGQYSFADYPNGGLRSSANDLAGFGRMLLGGGSLEGTRVLAEASVDEMMDADLTDGDEGMVGLGWFTLPWYDEGWGDTTGERPVPPPGCT